MNISTNSTTSVRRSILVLAALWLLATVGAGGYLIARALTQNPVPASDQQLVKYSPTPSVPRAMTRRIETIRVGMRVLGQNPDASEVDETLPDPVADDWRHLKLRMVKENGDDLSIELLRPLEWLSFYEVAVGRTIDLDLSEMGAEGPAEVRAVEPCPPIVQGPGNVVTGTFAHRSSGDLINLMIGGESRPIGVTRNHRYWSEDRKEFVAASDLYVGERLLTLAGHTTTLVAVAERPTNEPVYNLEVHREHVYFVGNRGVAVHNNCGIVGLGKNKYMSDLGQNVLLARGDGWTNARLTNYPSDGIEEFERAFRESLKNAKEIKFNLRGVDIDAMWNMKRSVGPILMKEKHLVTEWELMQVIRNREFLSKTEFLFHGTSVKGRDYDDFYDFLLRIQQKR